MNFNQILNDYFLFFMLWELVWKAFALWKSARRNELVWFICIIGLNSLGIIPITYLIYDRFFRQKYQRLASGVATKLNSLGIPKSIK